MLEPSSNLGSFVCPIPICQPEADLGSILKIFQNMRCKSIAIPLSQESWGIINSEDLLSLIGKKMLSKQMVLVAHPKNGSYQADIHQLTIPNLNSLIKPAIIYQADTELEELIGGFEPNSWLSDRLEYLVVDRMGKLRGKLDRNKILGYLAIKSRQATTKNSEPLSLDWSNLIERLSLPLSIESATGETIHANQSWQKSNFSKLIPESRLEKSPTADYNRLASNLSADILATFSSENSTPVNHNRLNRNSSLKKPFSNPIEGEIELQIERVGNWNLLKMPLATIGQQAQTQILSSYWIVLAIKIPHKQLHQATSITLEKESICNLLASLSHELKSPLTGIVGLSSLLKAEKIGKLNQRQARYVNLIQNGSHQANAIIKDLLKLINLARQQLPLETVDLELLCHQLYQQVSKEIQSSPIREHNCAVEPKPDLAIEPSSKFVTINREVLFGVLYHLAVEIFKTVNSLPRKIKISNLQGLTVIEISAKARERNFSPPKHSDSVSANSGFNLAIARYLAETIAGSINIIYAKDYCQFTLRLPHNSPEAKSKRDTKVNTQVKIHCSQTAAKSMTILCLYPELAASDPQIPLQNDTLALKSWIERSDRQDERHRIIEADSLEQAHTLARIWQLDVVVLDGYRIADPVTYLRSLLESKYLSTLPLITLDARTTEAANQLPGLNVYPCLLPAQQRNFTELMQVIRIATGA